jgi:hypothetical protein
LFHELCVEACTEAIGHQAFDHARDFGLGVTFAVDEADGHALVWGAVTVDVFAGDDALDLAVDREWLVAAGDEELEEKLGPDGKRSTRLDERSAARDVLRVIGKERVETFVFDFQLDRPPG